MKAGFWLCVQNAAGFSPTAVNPMQPTSRINATPGPGEIGRDLARPGDHKGAGRQREKDEKVINVFYPALAAIYNSCF